jgi:Collagen triple helix repeat (20 copies)
MFSRIRKRITYANVAMTLALVFAMTGGAYAAKHYLITSTKQISPKVLKSLKGANGKTGAAGLAGAAGAAGAQGPTGPAGAGKEGSPGKEGAKGTTGEKGATGTAGTSVTSKKVEPGEPACNKEGGSEFTAGASKTTACNGKTGPVGPEGVCSTSSCHLPSGVTETGEYALYTTAAKIEEYKITAISFPIQLAAAPEHVTFVHVGTSGTGGCEGTVAEPKAKPGNLCIFEGELAGIHLGGLSFFVAVDASGAFAPGKTGAELLFTTLPPKCYEAVGVGWYETQTKCENGEKAATQTFNWELEQFPKAVSAEGTWAVTAK